MAWENIWFTVCAVFVGMVAFFSLGVMFVRATNIDRNALVGVLSFVTAMIAAGILYASRNVPMDSWAILLVGLFSMTGFFLGRLIDRMLGPTGPSTDARNATLGSDLSD